MDRYGEIHLTWIREYRRPTGISRFPDGGKPLEVRMYAIVVQADSKGQRDIGRIDLEPVRRGDFGNLNDAMFDWLSPSRLSYRVEYGYHGDLVRSVEGEISLTPLK